MITIDKIKKWAKPHDIGNGAKVTRFGNEAIEFSIVGGGTGLYGNFEDTFEVAIFDNLTGEFMTKFFYPEGSDDVIPYMSGEELVEMVNKLMKGKDFQVR